MKNVKEIEMFICSSSRQRRPVFRDVTAVQYYRWSM